MMYKKVLEKLGLVENVDFALTAESFEMLPKQVEVEISPAVLDEEGNVVSPAVTEMQSFTPEAPSVEVLEATWKEIQLDEADLPLLIEEFLSDKAHLRDQEEDSINIVNKRIYSWSFKNIPQPTNDELVALIPVVQAKQIAAANKSAKLEAGKKARQACTNCLDIIAGYNLEQELTAEQITEMQTTFAPIQSALMTARPTTAKALITALVPDGVLVTQELKDLVLVELSEY